MEWRLIIFCVLLFNTQFLKAQDSLMLRKIYDEELVNGQCYENLRYLCKQIGPRLSGSTNAQQAVFWGKRLMESYHFDRVYLQQVTVPHWVRGGKEKGAIVIGQKRIPVPITALGMSVATPPDGITAKVVEVHSLKELDTLGEQRLRGKIVFFNQPMDPRYIETGYASYMVGNLRTAGPAAAAKYGAIAAIVRSLTLNHDNFPHTGTMHYDNGPKIPAAAISTLAADTLSDLLKNNKNSVQFFLKQNCQNLPDTISYNVVGEITGSKNPNTYVTIGGHLDSWDLAEGAHDDGTGVTQSVEVLRIFKMINYHPLNTIRVVFFINEENGNRGGLKYASLAFENKEKHLAAIESDLGGFTPRGFDFTGLGETQLKKIQQDWRNLFRPYDLDRFIQGYGGGTDTAPLSKNNADVVLVNYLPDMQRYFDVHHCANDVFENVNKRELELGAGAIAGLVYLIDQHGF
jgi:carboxypeptidase Q